MKPKRSKAEMDAEKAEREKAKLEKKAAADAAAAEKVKNQKPKEPVDMAKSMLTVAMTKVLEATSWPTKLLKANVSAQYRAALDKASSCSKNDLRCITQKTITNTFRTLRVIVLRWSGSE